MNIKKIFTIATLIFPFISCSFFGVKETVDLGKSKSSEIEPEFSNAGEERKWTILIYMCGDNNLETAALNDIREMESSLLDTNQVTVLFLLDRSSSYNASFEDWSGTRLYKLVTGGRKNQTAIMSTRLDCRELGLTTQTETELDMADEDTLSTVLSYSIKRFPAENYGLIMWGHGSGWKSDSENLETVDSGYKGFSYDESSGSYMSLRQLGKGIKKALNGEKLKLIGFDTCYGGEVEVMYELRDCADYCAGSEGLVSSEGWNYEVLFNSFNNSRSFSVEAFLECCLSQFKKQYEGTSRASFSVCNLNFIEDYVTAFNSFCKNVSGKINSSLIRDSVFGLVYSRADCPIERYSYGREGYDVYLDCLSLVENLGLELQVDTSDFMTWKNKCVVNSWASDRREAGPGVYFQTLGTGGLLLSVFNQNYVSGQKIDQIDFVKNCNGYVPTVNKEGSLLDKLFFYEF